MIVHEFQTPPPASLAGALARFETQFTYPLGAGRSFRISHGDDYPRFFRAIGEAKCFVAEEDDRVVGTLGAALRTLLLPNGNALRVAYLADLKVARSSYRGRVLLRLLNAARQWAAPYVSAAFGIVMDGTPITPQRYTGRLGLPAFEELANLVVLRLIASSDPAEDIHEFVVTADRLEDCYRRLSGGRYAAIGGDPPERSETEPVWFMLPDGSACGRLEDTRRAKRLVEAAGEEMVSAHLSSFAYRDAEAGAVLLRAALARANREGFPALFVSVLASGAPELLRYLQGINTVSAPATIYGTGLQPGMNWNVNSAEI